MTARFHQPFYDGDTVTVEVASVEPTALELTATNDAGTVCATGRAALPSTTDAAAPPDPADYPETPLPDEPAPATPEALAALDVLGSLEAGFHADRAHGFLGQLDDDLALYARDRIAHPGWLLRAANDVLAANLRLGPWIHTASAVQNHSALHDGERLSARGRVAGLSERRGNDIVDLDVLLVAEATRARVSGLSTRKGHEVVELDVMLLANRDRPVAHIRHSAIYRLREPGAAT